MNYFDYAPKCNTHLGKVWDLFESMSMDEINLNSYEYSLDIIKSAIQGNITNESCNGEAFQLKDYTYGCKRNEKISRRNNVKKELFIVDSFTEDESEKIGFGDVSDRVLKDVDLLFDKVIDNETFEESLTSLMGIRNKYLVKYGVDVVSLIKSALSGAKSSIKVLSKLVRNDRVLGNIIEGLLGTGHDEVVIERLKMLEV